MKAKQFISEHFSKFVRLDKPHISNSYLSTLKRALLGEEQMTNTQPLKFGTEHHSRALEPDKPKILLNYQNELCDTMSESFIKHRAVQTLLSQAKTEVQYDAMYKGVHVQVRIDIDRPEDWFDLKGTTCRSEKDFIRKAREYDYFRQAALYEIIVGTPGTFIGQSKTAELCDQYDDGAVYYVKNLRSEHVRHPLFWLPANDFPSYMKESFDELHYLIDIHKQLRKYYAGKSA